MWAGPGTNVDFLDCVKEMREAVEHFLLEGGNGAAALLMMSSQAEGIEELGLGSRPVIRKVKGYPQNKAVEHSRI